jgi:dTDP-L-rhamnose 4-epimerase
MPLNVLVTGGAGFIGQALCKELLDTGYRVRVLDVFAPQIHGTNRDLPDELKKHVELIRGDICDISVVTRALKGIEVVMHLAAETGTGQSMYEIARYFNVNVQGTAVLLDALQNDEVRANLRSVIVASSRAVYGEGSYYCQQHGVV